MAESTVRDGDKGIDLLKEAKFSSGLSVFDFIKRHSLIKISKTGIERLGPSVINLARYENLEGHAKSIRVRIEKDK